MKIYVQAKSKADINRRIKAGEQLSGYNYAMFGGGGEYELNTDLPDGTIVAVYEKMVNGNPHPKSWGSWNASKNKLS